MRSPFHFVFAVKVREDENATLPRPMFKHKLKGSHTEEILKETIFLGEDEPTGYDLMDVTNVM